MKRYEKPVAKCYEVKINSVMVDGSVPVSDNPANPTGSGAKKSVGIWHFLMTEDETENDED